MVKFVEVDAAKDMNKQILSHPPDLGVIRLLQVKRELKSVATEIGLT